MRGKRVGGSVAAGVALLIMTGESPATDRVNIRGMGMARASVASSRNFDAVGINPANLAFPGNDIFTFTILPLGAYVGTDFLTYEIYSKYFTNGTSLIDLPESDKQAILSSFHGPMGTSHAEVAARLFGLSLRTDKSSSIVFTVDYSLIGAADIPREYADLLMHGNVPGSTFDVDGLAIQAYWARLYTLSFGSLLPAPAFLEWLAGGVSVKLVQGYGYYEIQNLNASLTANEQGLLSGGIAWDSRSASTGGIKNPAGDLFQNPAGYGLGVDVGISGGITRDVSFGIAITGIGWIDWKRDVEQVRSDTIAADESPDVFKSVRTLANSVSGTKTEQPFSSQLPRLLRVGVAAQIDRLAGAGAFPGELLLAVEYMDGIGPNSPLLEKPRLALACEYKPVRWLPLRTGVAFGGNGNAQVAFGFGLFSAQLDVDIGTEDLSWLFKGKSFSTGSLGFGFRFRVQQ